ncbi:LuxR C-terminal-related transcriptional regulator [Nocardioides sp. YIM B13467]|uniref:helix-turn-helix transcriptional regulator n=1 Tax=Nocardioides sp. YIM B13467 TaxID=3366294 RepID=UPI00366F4B4B
MNRRTRQRSQDKIERLSRQGLDLVALWRECREPIADAIPHYWAPCFYTLDPASLLITSHFDELLPVLPADFLDNEYRADGVHKLSDVAKSELGVSTLYEITDGDPSSTSRWKSNMELGGDQEIIVSLRTRAGVVWGSLALYREPGRPMFCGADKEFLRAIAPSLAEAARNALLLGEASDPDSTGAPGLVVLNSSLGIDSATEGVERWLADLPRPAPGAVPVAVAAVAARALRSVDSPGESGEVATSRVLSESGTWIVLHGAVLATRPDPQVAVIVEPAHPARIATLLMSAYGMTDREKELTQLVLKGLSTVEIAQALVISPHTVQQHLKHVFEKTGVRSRRDLVAKVFFSHYEGRLRDNERRAASRLPLRGGPMPGPVDDPVTPAGAGSDR